MSRICALSQTDPDGGWDCIEEDCAWWMTGSDDKETRGDCTINWIGFALLAMAIGGEISISKGIKIHKGVKREAKRE